MDALPLAYLITFRSYGTWLHGDPRGAVNRFRNQYGREFIERDDHWLRRNQKMLNETPVTLDLEQRREIESAIRQTCDFRMWPLHAVNIRTNHVHAVVSTGETRPGIVLNAFKANATSRLRKEALWNHQYSPWSDGGSKRYLWTQGSMERAIDYVMKGQDHPSPNFR